MSTARVTGMPAATCDPDTAALCGLYEAYRAQPDSDLKRRVCASFGRRVRELAAVVCGGVLYRWDATEQSVARDARAIVGTFWSPTTVELMRRWRAADPRNGRKPGKGADVAA